jgi:hypothetical protein
LDSDPDLDLDFVFQQERTHAPVLPIHEAGSWLPSADLLGMCSIGIAIAIEIDPIGRGFFPGIKDPCHIANGQAVYV